MDQREDESGKPRLDRKRILDAGVHFVESHGVHQLSMRRLGQDLGYEAMSLYRYVQSREDLLDGIVDSVLDELDSDSGISNPSDRDWQEYLRDLAHGLRSLALAHPQIFPLVATRPPEAPWVRPPVRSLRLVEGFLDTMSKAGFSDRAAVDAYRAFSSFLLGHLLLEVSAMGADVGPVEVAKPRKPRAADLAEHPVLQRFQTLLSRDRSEEEFAESLEDLLLRIGSFSSAP